MTAEADEFVRHEFFC